MSDFEFQKVNSRVICSGDNYLAKVDSAETFSSIFVDEETTYGISVRDAKIQTGDSAYTPAMAFTYSMEHLFLTGTNLGRVPSLLYIAHRKGQL